MKSIKITEITGKHELVYDDDYIFDNERGSVGLLDLIPPEALEKEGRWRITVEFEAEPAPEEPAK